MKLTSILNPEADLSTLKVNPEITNMIVNLFNQSNQTQACVSSNVSF